MGNLAKILRLMFGSISMPNRPFASESIVSLSDLDVETKMPTSDTIFQWMEFIHNVHP
jgi:hypothetical protein